MVKPGADRLKLGGALVLMLLAGWMLWPSVPAPVQLGPKAVPATPGPRPRGARSSPGSRRGKTAQLAPIDLARLDDRPSGLKVGRRDIFDFEPLPPPPPPAATPAPPPVMTQHTAPAPPPTPAGPPPPVPLNVKFIGAMEEKARGIKVAILLTDKQEILTGKQGEVVANRLKIISIGVESVDVQDVGATNTRRLPLKGN